MFSVMLVDDEVWSLRGLEQLLPWGDMGYRIAATYNDSVDALEAIASAHPDVVFTDIRMPELSGIDLIREARKLVPSPEFVVISGYNDFKYAQSAVHLGAFDYCLKPIDVDEGVQLLERLSVRLKSRRRESDSRTYRDIVSGKGKNVGLLKVVSTLPPNVDRSWVAFAVRSRHSELLEEAAAGEDVRFEVLTPDTELSILLVNGTTEPLERIAESLHRTLSGVDACAGMSSFAADGQDLPHLVQEAEMASAQRFIGPAAGIVRYDARRSEHVEKLSREMEAALASYNFLRGNLIIDRFPELVRREHLGIHHVVNFWNRFVKTISEWKVDLLPAIAPDHLEYEHIVERFETIDGLAAHMKDIVARGRTSLRLGTETAGNINSRFIDLLEFVNRNYRSRLKLSELAEEYGLNFSYCSDLFRRCTNGTFSDYVTGLRMKEALALGKSGKHSAQEIAELVGYSDYFYFSRKFKQYYGVSPNQVRSVDQAH